jgi:hypothetical protein
MRYFKIILVAFLVITLLYSCNDKLNVNAQWKDITVVYGLLSQNDDTAYIKITKAFLGNGNALQYAKIPDSSTYPGNLNVRMEAWSGSTLVNTYVFDTITIHTKQAGDSIFYFPTQMVYFCKTGHLDQNNTYRLKITHTKTGVIDSASTALVHSFNVDNPDPYIKLADFIPGQYFDVKFDQAYGGKRYQLVIRFHYLETAGGSSKPKSFEWLVFNDYEVSDPYELSSVPIDQTFSSDAFYTIAKANIKTLKEDPSVSSRAALYVDFIFSVASDDLNTYMNATEPSLSIVQERPSFTNIYNGIGLFSSRYVNELDTVQLGANTISEFTTDTAFINRGF